jgi:SAM-dependent methyltransferase
MRKDYIPVDTLTERLDEGEFVERHWTANWRDWQASPDASAVARREEYRLMEPFLRRMPAGSRILDGGCGLGEWTVFLGDQGFDVVGLDLSADVVQRLKQWFPHRTFARGDIRQLEFDTASFDAYFSWGAFEHFENGLGACLEEAHRVLKPGGFLFLSVPFQNRRHLRRDARALERWDAQFDPRLGYRQPHRFYQWRFTRSELRRELELRGFRTVVVSPIGKDAGIGRWLQWDVRLLRRGAWPYAAACRILSRVVPASYISHMLFAAAERR